MALFAFTGIFSQQQHWTDPPIHKRLTIGSSVTADEIADLELKFVDRAKEEKKRILVNATF